MTIFDEVKKDFDKRDAIGYEQWKKELRPDDGRDWLLELYEELLDACVYLKGELLKRERAEKGVGPQIRPHPSRKGTCGPLPPNG